MRASPGGLRVPLSPRAAVIGVVLAWCSGARAEEPLRGAAGLDDPTGARADDQPARAVVATAGVHYRRVYGTPSWLAAASVGRSSRWLDVAAGLGRGRTSSSLSVSDLSATGYLHVRDRWLRLGVTGALGLLAVDRATGAGPLVLSYARVGARAEVQLAASRTAPLLTVDLGVAGPSADVSLLVAAGARF